MVEAYFNRLSKFTVNAKENKDSKRNLMNRMSYREISFIVGYLSA